MPFEWHHITHKFQVGGGSVSIVKPVDDSVLIVVTLRERFICMETHISIMFFNKQN